MFYERLLEICNNKELKITPLVVSLNMSKGNIEKWRNGMVPNGDSLLKLSKKLDCSIDYLLGLSDNPYSLNFLSDDEQKIISAYRENTDFQEAVKKLLDTCENNKSDE